jgi:hypothetical protein
VFDTSLRPNVGLVLMAPCLLPHFLKLKLTWDIALCCSRFIISSYCLSFHRAHGRFFPLEVFRSYFSVTPLFHKVLVLSINKSFWINSPFWFSHIQSYYWIRCDLRFQCICVSCYSISRFIYQTPTITYSLRPKVQDTLEILWQINKNVKWPYLPFCIAHI